MEPCGRENKTFTIVSPPVTQKNREKPLIDRKMK